MFQDKAQTAKNGPVLLKGCNTVLGHLGSSLRASREAVVRGVTPLGNCSLRCSTSCIPAVVGKDPAIAGETCLAPNRFTTR